MRAVVQRVSRASVVVAGGPVAAIGNGLLVYLGIESGDSQDDARYIADKVRYLRIFPDGTGPMNRDLLQAEGAVLMVSAFTTAADARRGRRPSFDHAAGATEAQPLYQRVCQMLEEQGIDVQRGRFGTMMEVESTNTGPICILLDSRRAF